MPFSEALLLSWNKYGLREKLHTMHNTHGFVRIKSKRPRVESGSKDEEVNTTIKAQCKFETKGCQDQIPQPMKWWWYEPYRPTRTLPAISGPPLVRLMVLLIIRICPLGLKIKVTTVPATIYLCGTPFSLLYEPTSCNTLAAVLPLKC